MKEHVTTRDAIIEAGDNHFVNDIDPSRKKIIYSKDFYVAMFKRLEKGMTPIEAYEDCGFSVEKLGESRAYACAQRANKMCSKQGYTLDPSSYDGSISRDQMGELSFEEEIAYNKARVIFLEAFVEVQKKIQSYLAENDIF